MATKLRVQVVTSEGNQARRAARFGQYDAAKKISPGFVLPAATPVTSYVEWNPESGKETLHR